MKIEERIMKMYTEGIEEIFTLCDHTGYENNPFGKTFCLACGKRLSRPNEEEKALRERLAEVVHYASDRRKEAHREWLVRGQSLTNYRAGFLEGLGEALEEVLILCGEKLLKGRAEE